MRNIACIIARTNSKRLPKKVLRDINGVKLIEYLIKKIKRSKYVSEIYLCTSIDEEDNVLLKIASENNIKSYAGSRDSVIDRMLKVAKRENADNIIRITGDNIFTDEVYLDMMLKYHERNKTDYTRTEYLPIGVTSEIVTTETLRNCYNLMDPNFSEYLLLYMFQPENYKCQVLIPEKDHQNPSWSLTVDTITDLQRTLEIVNDNERLLNYEDIVNICKKNKIHHLTFNPKGSIKFPAGVTLAYKTFRSEMQMRIERSQKVYLRKGEYKEMLNEQRI